MCSPRLVSGPDAAPSAWSPLLVFASLGCPQVPTSSERRIQFIHVGRHVRIADTVLDAFVGAGVVEPVLLRRTRTSR